MSFCTKNFELDFIFHKRYITEHLDTVILLLSTYFVNPEYIETNKLLRVASIKNNKIYNNVAAASSDDFSKLNKD